MSEDEATKIANAVVHALEGARSLSREEHDSDHVWVRTQRDKEKRKQEIWEQIKIHLMKYGAVAMVSAMFLAVWHYLKTQVHQ